MGSAYSHDEDLLIRLKEGDRNAFDMLYQRHWLKLYRLSCHITDDQFAAEDIVQETFISFWEKGRLKAVRNVEAYLYQTVKFLCFMHLRSGSISKKHLEHFASIAATRTEVESEYDVNEMRLLMEECIATLPEKCREVYYLSRVEHLPNKQIAERLHISPKTVENQITKALRHLRLSLGKLASLILFITSF